MKALATYAKQLGWLHTKPEGSELTRLQLYNQWDDWPNDLESVSYLITAALGLRLGVPTDKGGLLPHKWSDVVSYAKEVACLTEPWEINTLMDMSEGYVNEFMNGRDPLRTSPMDIWRRERNGS